jgi:hypothetical protein
MNSNPNNSILSPERESVTRDEVGAELLGVIDAEGNVPFDVGDAVAGERVGFIVLLALVGSWLIVGAHVGLPVLSAQLGS